MSTRPNLSAHFPAGSDRHLIFFAPNPLAAKGGLQLTPPGATTAVNIKLSGEGGDSLVSAPPIPLNMGIWADATWAAGLRRNSPRRLAASHVRRNSFFHDANHRRRNPFVLAASDGGRNCVYRPRVGNCDHACAPDTGAAR